MVLYVKIFMKRYTSCWHLPYSVQPDEEIEDKLRIYWRTPPDLTDRHRKKLCNPVTHQATQLYACFLITAWA